MATDLDQKLLPDVITLPLIVVALVLTLTGLNPLLADKDLPIASALAGGHRGAASCSSPSTSWSRARWAWATSSSSPAWA